MKKRQLFLLDLLLTLSGCAHNGGPLVFVVTHTVGVDIQAASSSSATPGLTVGYKSVDVAVVPTQMATDGAAALRGCYGVGQNGAQTPARCSAEELARADTRRAASSSSQLPSQTAMVPAENEFIPAKLPRGPFTPTSSNIIPTVIAAPPPAAAPAKTGGDAGQFGETVEDAYSVYASFGTGTKTGSSGLSVDIGEVFATGDAAVQLAEGVNYYSSRAGNAAIVNAIANCAQQLAAAKNAGVDVSKLPSCPSGQATGDMNPMPTVTGISPNSATGPAAGAAAVTVSIALTGSGFTQSSKLNVSGNAGVTAGTPKVSGDGATLTADLTIAPGATKTPASISVTNPAPGGGTTTSATQTFTVQ